MIELEERFPSLVNRLRNDGHNEYEIERMVLQAIDQWLTEQGQSK